MLGAMRSSALAFVLLVAGCGGSPPRANTPADHPALDVRGEVCPGWTRHEAAGRTLFALPGDATREPRGDATAYVHAETEVYYELVEEVVTGIGEAGSDRAVIEGVLAADGLALDVDDALDRGAALEGGRALRDHGPAGR